MLEERLPDAGAREAAAKGEETRATGGENGKSRPPNGKKKFFRWPPPLLPLLGGLLVLGLLAAGGTKAMLAYTDRPDFCLSCHVMEEHYETWFHSAHRLGATCGDCHVPHQNLAAKLVGKSIDGARDFFYFYTNQVPDPIRLSSRGSEIARENCLRCHGTVMENVVEREDRNCWECHRSVPHGQSP